MSAKYTNATAPPGALVSCENSLITVSVSDLALTRDTYFRAVNLRDRRAELLVVGIVALRDAVRADWRCSRFISMPGSCCRTMGMANGC
jgi:hypothetical protein